MSRPLHNTEQRANKVPNYAQAAAKSQQPQPAQQPTRGGHQPQPQPSTQREVEQPPYVKNAGPAYNKPTGGHSQYHGHNKHSYNNNHNSNRKDNTYVNRKASVQLPMPPPTDTAPIQFGSINQPSTASSNPSLPATAAASTQQQQQQQQQIPVVRAPAEAPFGSSPAVNDIHHRPPPPSASNQIRQSPQQQQQQQQQLKEIPRSPRTTNDGRLFTQPYAPRRDFNQGDHYNSNNRYNNNNSNNNYNNNNYRNNGYARPPPSHHSPNQPYHHHPHPVQYSPQQMPHQQNLPPSPMSHRASPNMNTYNSSNNNAKKNSATISPHIPHSSPQQNIQMATASWSSAGQYFYPQYPVSVPSYNVPAAATRPPIIPPPATRKRIAIIDPNTGVALNTNPMSLTSTSTASPSQHHPSPHKEEKHLDFVKPPHTSKAVSIVDPAIRDRELREKREREEAEQEAARKAEEDKKEAERKAAEEKERLEKERLEAERLEAERVKEEERKKEADRLEAERVEKERQQQEAAERKEAERVRLAEEASAIAAAALEKKKQEEESRRKAEEEKEAKRVISELEAEKKRQEEVSAQKVGRVPHKLEMPASSPAHSDARKQQPVKVIDDFSAVHYPAGITPPGVQDSQKHVYSIDFLLQFQQLCLDTNEDLSAINLSEMGTHSRSGSMRQPSDRGGRGGPRTPGASSNMTGDSMFRMNSRDGRMEMGKFNMGRPLTGRNNSSHMERQGSHGGGGGGRGGGSMRGGRGGGSGMKVIRNPAILNQQQGAPTIPMEQVAPLEKTENRWVPTVASQVAQPPAEGELMSQEYITRKVNALLNKLTVEKFDSISAQIFEYARQSAKENDGRSLRTVMKLTFEKACDEPAFASMWARLCRSMYDAMTDDIKDTSILDENNKPSSGILLFRKYLFNRCQVEFEKGWKVNMPEVDEVDGMMTEEYYIAAKAKRQGLGLIQFIGELFKLEMLSERIMYGCMIKLCNDPTNAGDEEAESLCKLLTTIGKALDSKPKTAKWVDIVIQRMKNEMVLSPKLTSRVKFMIQDLVDLRKDKWVPRIGGNQVGPTTIAKIHEMAEKAKEEKEAAAAATKRNNSSRGGQYIPNNNQYNNNNNNMARGNSYRGNNGGGKDYFNNNNGNSNHSNNNSNNNNNASNSSGGDGWNTVATGANNKSRPTDLSNFGKTDRSRSRTNILGPSNSPFPSLSRGKSATNLDTKNMDGRSSPATNMFSALLNGSGDKPEERKKLNLAPRSSSTTAEAAPAEKAPKLSDEAIKRKCKNIIEEYQSIRDKKELVECVKELDDPDYLVVLISEMLTVVEKKAQDVDDMCKTIEYLNSEKLLQKDVYVKAFKQFMEGYDDLTIDVPQAPKYVAQLMIAASVAPEEVGGDEYDSLQKAYKTLVESH
ncbi:hypothetical protein MBANPS3_001739 [Mucor bainieri]